MSLALKYAQQQLAFTGFAILSAPIAAELRPDLFSNGLAAGGEFRDTAQRNTFGGLPRVTVMRVRLDGIEQPVRVLARSTARLAGRIAELTGYQVTELVKEDGRPAAEAAEGRARRDASRRKSIADQVRLAKMRELAAQELPLHQCANRSEILKARAELARMGEQVGGFVPV